MVQQFGHVLLQDLRIDVFVVRWHFTRKYVYFYPNITDNHSEMVSITIISHDISKTWYRFQICRRHAFEILLKNRRRIGGKNIIVELDEAYFGKPKYNRGRKKEGTWFFGAMERHNKRSCFFFPVKRRTKPVLQGIIKK